MDPLKQLRKRGPTACQPYGTDASGGDCRSSNSFRSHAYSPSKLAWRRPYLQADANDAAVGYRVFSTMDVLSDRWQLIKVMFQFDPKDQTHFVHTNPKGSNN